MSETEKLQKILARAGIGSRRLMEQWISDGRVLVNGKMARVGDRVDTQAIIKVDGRVIPNLSPTTIKPRVLLYNKSSEEVCTRHDPENRQTVFTSLPAIANGRWINIGRLDLNTSGILLFTNDGNLANQLMHPKNEIEREYAVRILGEVDESMLKNLREGVHLEDGIGKFKKIIDGGGQGANHWYHVVVTEGRNRLVRRLWESQGVTVSRLIRVRFGPIQLPSRLKQGKWIELNEALVKLLSK